MTDGKVAIVTGGARGIGAAVVRKFARQGFRTVSADQLAEGEQVCAELRAQGFVSNFMNCDVANEADVQRVVSETARAFGGLDVLVNNAGVVLVKPLHEIGWDEFRRVVDINLGGTFLFCKHAIPQLKQRGGGAIVNMASVSGHIGQTDHAVYGSTKGAILSLTRALAWEIAPHKIRVNSVSPGSVDTPMLRGDIQLEAGRTGLPYDAVKAKREAEQAFGRWADPSEIAEAVYFLASDAASFVTGTDLLVDCGWVAK